MRLLCGGSGGYTRGMQGDNAKQTSSKINVRSHVKRHKILVQVISPGLSGEMKVASNQQV